MSDVPYTAAGIQLSRWLDAFNSANKTSLLSFHDEFFPYEVASRDIRSIGNELVLRRVSGGFHYAQTKLAKDYALSGLLKERCSLQYAAVSIEVENKPPHIVSNFEITPIQTLDELLTPEQRHEQHLDETTRKTVVYSLTESLEKNYLSKTLAATMSNAIKQNLASSKYSDLNNSASFAKVLTDDLHAIGHDGHMSVRFLSRVDADHRRNLSRSDMVELNRELNYGFTVIDWHDRGIVRVRIDALLPLEMEAMQEETGKIMSSISNATAAIIDLRENGGGDPHTVAFILSYVFGDEKVHLNDIYFTKTDKTESFWTNPKVKGKRFGMHKPLYVLTSNKTFSGGEEMAYDLQSLKRATLVGETTGGGANLPSLYELGHQFNAAIPDAYPINPITKKNWQGVGVTPDVPTTAKNALGTALKMARDDLAVSAYGKEGIREPLTVQSPNDASTTRYVEVQEL